MRRRAILAMCFFFFFFCCCFCCFYCIQEQDLPAGRQVLLGRSPRRATQDARRDHFCTDYLVGGRGPM